MKRMVVIVLGVLLVGILLYVAWEMDSRHETSSKKYSDEVFVAQLAPRKDKVNVAVYCNENEFQNAFRSFLNHLGEEKAVPLPVPGGPMLLAKADMEVPQDIQPAKRTSIEILKRYSPGKIILISHSECLLYDSIAAWNDQKNSLVETQRQDLIAARQVAQIWFPGVEVQTYYARKDGEKLRFILVR